MKEEIKQEHESRPHPFGFGFLFLFFQLVEKGEWENVDSPVCDHNMFVLQVAQDHLLHLAASFA